jgi:hypothetical protein
MEMTISVVSVRTALLGGSAGGDLSRTSVNNEWRGHDSGAEGEQIRGQEGIVNEWVEECKREDVFWIGGWRGRKGHGSKDMGIGLMNAATQSTEGEGGDRENERERERGGGVWARRAASGS